MRKALIVGSCIVVLAILAALWISQKRSSSGTSKPVASLIDKATSGKRLFTDYGIHGDAKTGWRVEVNEGDGKAHISRKESSETFDNWRAGEGWCVYFENDDRVWLYDGAEKLLLLAVEPQLNGGSTLYGPHRFPYAIPDDLKARLQLTYLKQLVIK